jgi:hypothetical protein
MAGCRCCICKADVSAQDARGFDPCALIIVASWSKPSTAQREQQFFCHFECFRKMLNDDGDLYIMDPEFEPNVAIDPDE